MNTAATIRKQFIMDAQGREIGVILPIEDYIFVEPLLRQREQQNPGTTQETVEEKLRKIELAQVRHEKNFPRRSGTGEIRFRA